MSLELTSQFSTTSPPKPIEEFKTEPETTKEETKN
jgi:hypothetical protein